MLHIPPFRVCLILDFARGKQLDTLKRNQNFHRSFSLLVWYKDVVVVVCGNNIAANTFF